MTRRHYSLNDYCRETFHEKVYRLSINGGMTCPNRDGSLSDKGCAFCSAGGSGDFATEAHLSIGDQLVLAKKRICAKTDCHSYIAYFQAYTRKIFYEAINTSDVVALSIATRSDCLNEEIYELLDELNQIKPVWIELGLQTIHNDILSDMNTHTRVEDFNTACQRLSQLGINVIAHLILGLPGETKEIMFESVRHIASLRISGVKLQLLHVLKGTDLASDYEKGLFQTLSFDEYMDLLADCVRLLPKDMVVHRLTGDGPKNLLMFEFKT